MRNIIVVKTYSVHGLFVKRCTISIPKDSEVLIFSLHTFDVPVVGFFWWIGCLQNLSNVKPPVSYAHINTAGIVGEGNIITVRIDR